MAALTPKQKKALARKAAKARWEKEKMTKRHIRTSGPASRASRSSRNTFGEALVEAQQRLAEALNQREFHASEYHRLNAEIPSLQGVVTALQRQQGVQPQQQPPMGVPTPVFVPPLPPSYSMQTVVSDEPILVPAAPEATQVFVMPPNQAPPAPVAQMPKPPLPQRGGGMAVGGEDLSSPEDDDVFLKEANTNMARSGQWHG